MLTIYLKELRSNFKSFFGWLFLAVYTFFCSLYFVIYNIMNVFQNVIFIAIQSVDHYITEFFV